MPCLISAQDGLTGSAWGDWANYTASPLRAFESELGVQDPVGFWDPVGFTSDGDVASFKRRRSVELRLGSQTTAGCLQRHVVLDDLQTMMLSACKEARTNLDDGHHGSLGLAYIMLRCDVL